MTSKQLKLSNSVSSIEILENNFGTLTYHPSIGLMHHEFHRFVYGYHFREIMSQGLRIFKDQNCNKWLSDDRKTSVLPSDDMEWINDHWNDQMIRSGWKYWALIMPNREIGKVHHQDLVDTYTEMGVTVQIFDTPSEAFVWLTTLPD